MHEKVEEIEWSKIQNSDMKIKLRRQEFDKEYEKHMKSLEEFGKKYKLKPEDSVHPETLEIQRAEDGNKGG